MYIFSYSESEIGFHYLFPQNYNFLSDTNVEIINPFLVAYQAMLAKREILKISGGVNYICGVARAVCVDSVRRVYKGDQEVFNSSKVGPYTLRESAIKQALLKEWDKKQAEEIYDSNLCIHVLEELCY